MSNELDKSDITSDHSTDIVSKSKNGSYYMDEYFSMKSFKNEPVTFNWLLRAAKSIKEYADKDDTYRISDWHDINGMTERDYYKFVAKYDIFKEAHEYLKRRIASRKDKGALMGKYNVIAAYKNMDQYCNVTKASLEFQANLRNQEQGNGPTFNLLMNTIESTGQVKPRITKEKDVDAPSKD